MLQVEGFILQVDVQGARQGDHCSTIVSPGESRVGPVPPLVNEGSSKVATQP